MHAEAIDRLPPLPKDWTRGCVSPGTSTYHQIQTATGKPL
jgi:hypothetical protein